MGPGDIIRLSLGTTVLLLGTVLHAESLRPFSSDGCSAFPDGTPAQQTLWLQCCLSHDYAYWQGGTHEERLAADNALRDCVSQTGEPQIAAMMLAAVRIGGTPYLPTRFRWGYGWPWPRGYRALSADERAEIQRASTAEQ